MNRTQIIQQFRDDSPEITANVISDITLNSWLLVGDKEVCAKTSLIVSSGSIPAVSGQANYDVTTLSKFYTLDENPGGGITRVNSDGNEKRLDKTSKSELDFDSPSWRTASSGTPKKFFRRGKYIYVYPKPDSSITQFNLDFVCISDDFNSDAATPYNQLSYLEPFHPALIFYLTMRAKAKVGKPDEATSAMNFYNSYIAWMQKIIGGGKFSSIEFRPSGLPSTGFQR